MPTPAPADLLPISHALVVELRDLLQAASFLVALVGIPVAFWKYFSEKKKDRVTREKEAFSVSNKRYAEYLEMLLRHDAADMFDIAERVTTGADSMERPELKRLIMITWLVAMIETAFVWYYYDRTPELKKQWAAWERYIDIWIARSDFRRAWPHVRELFHDSFVEYMNVKVTDADRHAGALQAQRQDAA